MTFPSRYTTMSLSMWWGVDVKSGKDGRVLELIQSFVDNFLVEVSGNTYIGLFLFVWLFSVVNPLAPPEEAFTLLSGACMSYGIIKPLWGGVAMVAAIVVTNNSQYWIGRGVLKLLSGTRIGQRLQRSKAFLKAQSKMQQKGIWAIVGCRFFFGTRAPTYLASGFLHFNFWKFFFVDSAVVIVHAIPFMVLGYVFSEQIDTVIKWVEKMGLWSALALVVGIAAFVVFRLVRKNQQT